MEECFFCTHKTQGRATLNSARAFPQTNRPGEQREGTQMVCVGMMSLVRSGLIRPQVAPQGKETRCTKGDEPHAKKRRPSAQTAAVSNEPVRCCLLGLERGERNHTSENEASQRSRQPRVFGDTAITQRLHSGVGIGPGLSVACTCGKRVWFCRTMLRFERDKVRLLLIETDICFQQSKPGSPFQNNEHDAYRNQPTGVVRTQLQIRA